MKHGFGKEPDDRHENSIHDQHPIPTERPKAAHEFSENQQHKLGEHHVMLGHEDCSPRGRDEE